MGHARRAPEDDCLGMEDGDIGSSDASDVG
jgi:hypothetical protein